MAFWRIFFRCQTTLPSGRGHCSCFLEMSAGKAKRGAPAKIKKLMKRFGTEAGKLNEEDLKELMRSVDRAEPLPRDVRWVMNMADLNGDGNIQTGELALALVSASVQEHACMRVIAQCYGQCSRSAARLLHAGEIPAVLSRVKQHS